MRYALALSAIGAGSLMIYAGFTDQPMVSLLRGLLSGQMPTRSTVPIDGTPVVPQQDAPTPKGNPLIPRVIA